MPIRELSADDFESDEPDPEFESDTTSNEAGEATLPAKGKNVTKLEMCVILGCARATLDEWIKQGCPLVSRGGRGASYLVNTYAVIQWRIQRLTTDVRPDDGNETNAAARAKEAQARLRELEVARREGKLIEVEVVTQFIKRVFGDVRAALHAIETQVPELDEGQRIALKSQLDDMADALSSDNAHNWSGTANEVQEISTEDAIDFG